MNDGLNELLKQDSFLEIIDCQIESIHEQSIIMTN